MPSVRNQLFAYPPGVSVVREQINDNQIRNSWRNYQNEPKLQESMAMRSRAGNETRNSNVYNMNGSRNGFWELKKRCDSSPSSYSRNCLALQRNFTGVSRPRLKGSCERHRDEIRKKMVEINKSLACGQETRNDFSINDETYRSIVAGVCSQVVVGDSNKQNPTSKMEEQHYPFSSIFSPNSMIFGAPIRSTSPGDAITEHESEKLDFAISDGCNGHWHTEAKDLEENSFPDFLSDSSCINFTETLLKSSQEFVKPPGSVKTEIEQKMVDKCVSTSPVGAEPAKVIVSIATQTEEEVKHPTVERDERAKTEILKTPGQRPPTVRAEWSRGTPLKCTDG